MWPRTKFVLFLLLGSANLSASSSCMKLIGVAWDCSLFGLQTGLLRIISFRKCPPGCSRINRWKSCKFALKSWISSFHDKLLRIAMRGTIVSSPSVQQLLSTHRSTPCLNDLLLLWPSASVISQRIRNLLGNPVRQWSTSWLTALKDASSIM